MLFPEGVKQIKPLAAAQVASHVSGGSRGMTAPVTIYGIKNCQTMRKARAWLDGHGIACHFHDYKTAGITHERLEAWVGKVGWEALLNRAGTTFRKLAEADKDGMTKQRAIRLMLAQPSVIRRPVLVLDDKVIVGFRPDMYEQALRPGQPIAGEAA